MKKFTLGYIIIPQAIQDVPRATVQAFMVFRGHLENLILAYLKFERLFVSDIKTIFLKGRKSLNYYKIQTDI